MTTDQVDPGPRATGFGMVPKVMLACLGVAIGWLAVLAVVMVLTDASPAALVLFPDAGFMAALPEGVAIASRNSFSVVLTGDVPGFGRALYSAGAMIVLPAGLLGCAPLTS